MLVSCGLQTAYAQLANFESWQNYNVAGVALQVPTGWHGLDSSTVAYGSILNPGAPFYAQVEKEMPGNGSATALKVITKNQSAITGFFPAGPFPSLASNANIVVNTGTGGFDFFGGSSFSNNPVSATMWVKNQPVGGDSTEITILAIDNSDGNDSIAAIADTLLGASINSWTKITLPFVYNPSGFSTTMIRVLITSSGNFGNDTITGAFTGLHDGTSISVDDIEIVAPTGVTQYIYSSKLANIYPTQVTDKLNVNLQYIESSSAYSFQVYDTRGVVVKTFVCKELLNVVDLSMLAKGNYIYALSKDQKIVQTGKVTRL